MLKRIILFPVFLFTLPVFICFAFLSFHPGNASVNHKMPSTSFNQIKLINGDLVFRRGVSFESQIVLLADRQSEYSHVGMIYNIGDKPFVIHSVPLETGTENEFIKLESLEKFLSTQKAERFALYRYDNEFNNVSQKASTFAYDCYLQNYSFDDDYDLKSDSKLYCTELIWKAYKYAGVDLVEKRFKTLNFIVITKKIIMPSSLIESKLLKNIYSN